MIVAVARSLATSWNALEFRSGLAAGAAASLVALVATLLASHPGRSNARWRRPLPLGGLAFTVAGTWSVSRAHGLPPAVGLAIVGAAVAGAVTGSDRAPSWLPFAISVPAAILVGAFGGVVQIGWVRVLTALAIAIGAPLAARADDAPEGPTLGLALLACSVAGAWATVPDTERAVALLGAVVVPTLLGWPAGIHRLGRSGAAAALTLLVWVSALDGRGRPTSVIGSVLALGLLVLLPAVRSLGPARRSPRRAPRWPRTWALALALGLHVAIVVVGSRVVGLLESVPLASVSAGAVLVLGLLAASGAATVIDAGAPGPKRGAPRGACTPGGHPLR